MTEKGCSNGCRSYFWQGKAFVLGQKKILAKNEKLERMGSWLEAAAIGFLNGRKMVEWMLCQCRLGY